MYTVGGKEQASRSDVQYRKVGLLGLMSTAAIHREQMKINVSRWKPGLTQGEIEEVKPTD